MCISDFFCLEIEEFLVGWHQFGRVFSNVLGNRNTSNSVTPTEVFVRRPCQEVGTYPYFITKQTEVISEGDISHETLLRFSFWQMLCEFQKCT
jgi:hypothetical protein